MPSPEIEPDSISNPPPAPRLWPVATVMATGVFATTFVQLQGLGYLPFNHLLMKDMGLDSNVAATFMSLSMVPWMFKTFAGLLVDGVPLFGTRRRSYLMLSAFTAGLLWLAMGCVPPHYKLLLWLSIVMNTAIVFGSTTSGGLLVEAGQQFGVSGRLSSLRVFAQNLGAALGLPVGGLIADHLMQGHLPLIWPALAAAVPLACLFFCTWFLLKEPPLPARSTTQISILAQLERALASIWTQITNVVRWQMLLPAALMFFIQVVPTFRSTCFYEYQTTKLHYSDAAIGLLGLAGYGAALLSSGVYVWWCRKVSLRTSLYAAIFVVALSALPYLYYAPYTPYMVRACSIEGVGYFLLYLAYLPLFDLAVRSTPKGSEALGYSLLIGVWNVGLGLGAKAGPWLYERYLHRHMNELIWLNAGVTMAGLILVFLLPRYLVERSEGK